MTQEEKQLLLKDLCARLPYGVMVSVSGVEFDTYQYPYLLTAISKFGLECLCKTYSSIYTPFGCPKVEDVKPYLRPMSSMTPEEYEIYNGIAGFGTDEQVMESKIDWLNENHFDYRGLIPMGLALEAKEGMYKTK